MSVQGFKPETRPPAGSVHGLPSLAPHMWGMTSRQTTLERAFELARSGGCLGIAEIRAQLKVEGHSLGQLEGPSLARQLREICAASRRTTDA